MNIKNKSSLLENISPIIKIIIVILVTITATLDRNPYFSIILFLFSIVIVGLYSDISIKEYLNRIKLIILMAIAYFIFLIISKKISAEHIDYEYMGALAFRFIIIGSYSIIFVNTVNPKEFVMSLIKYFKLSNRMGFAFLSAYRFFPTFSQELEQIKFSHATRGIGDSGIFSTVRNIKRYTVPMLVTAIRRGSRISISMESRGFGKYDERTYYNDLNIDDMDKRVLIVFLITYIFMLVILLQFNLIRLSAKF